MGTTGKKLQKQKSDHAIEWKLKEAPGRKHLTWRDRDTSKKPKPVVGKSRLRSNHDLTKLLDKVRALVLEIPHDKWFTREALAVRLKAKPHFIEQCLHKLNLEGLVNQPTHIPLHDCNRDRMFGFPNWSGWQADGYKRRTP